MKGLAAKARALAERALKTLPGRVVRKFAADNGPNQAVLIAWNALFSIFPIVLAMAAVLGLLLSSTGVKADAIYQTVLAIVPDQQGRAQALAGVWMRSSARAGSSSWSPWPASSGAAPPCSGPWSRPST